MQVLFKIQVRTYSFSPIGPGIGMNARLHRTMSCWPSKSPLHIPSVLGMAENTTKGLCFTGLYMSNVVVSWKFIIPCCSWIHIKQEKLIPLKRNNKWLITCTTLGHLLQTAISTFDAKETEINKIEHNQSLYSAWAKKLTLAKRNRKSGILSLQHLSKLINHFF